MTMYRRYGRKALGTGARLALAAFAALTLAGLPHGPAVRAVVAAGGQTITDLGTLGGASSVAYGINASGSVVGRSDTRAGYPHAFLWQGGTMTDLAPLSVLTSTATAINATGQVAGYASITDSAEHAFTWHAGLTTDLGTLPAGRGSYAAAINTAGQVAGYGDVPYSGYTGYSVGYAWRPFLASTGVITDLGLPYGSEGAQATGINNADAVVGTASNIGGSGWLYHGAFLSSGGTLAYLGLLSTGTDSYAEALNGAGHVVGAANTTFRGDTYHAVLWRDGAAVDLGTLDGASSHAYGINAFDQIVGTATTARGAFHAFLYRDGAMIDLNSVLPTGSTWTLTEARGINDAGQIVGTGTINGQEHAFLLTLAPLASSTATATTAPTGTPTATSPPPTSIPGTATIAATTTPGTPPATATATVTATASIGSFDLQPYDNNVGISSDSIPGAANFDGVGYSYSAQALQAAGFAQGQPVVVDGVTYQWPAADAGGGDNVSARGQAVTLPAAVVGGTALGILGAADHGPAAGTGTITYADGSTQGFTLALSDWTLDGGTAQPLAGDAVAATLPYRNGVGGPDARASLLFSVLIPLQADKVVAVVTLPDQAAIHIFAMTVSSAVVPGAFDPQGVDNNSGVSDDSSPRAANIDDVGYSYSDQTLRSAGIIQGQTVVYHGMAFRWPAVAPGMPDNVIARGQTITPTIPTRGATLAFVGMADHGPSIGTGTILYDDGSTQGFQLGFSDWTLNGGLTTQPSYTNGIVATLTYRNHSNGVPENVPTNLYEAAIPLQVNKVVVAVTLPADVAHGRLHIFAMTVTAQPLEQLDQAQLYDGRGLTVAEKAQAAQTITVGISGTLTRVALPFCTTITGSGADLTARATQEPMRSATASITFAHSFSDCAWYTFTFAHPISVAAGEVVRLAVTGRGGESSLWGANAGRGDPYPRGSGTWFGQPIEDFAFQTYVQPTSNA